MNDERRPVEEAANEADKTGQVDKSITPLADSSAYSAINAVTESYGNRAHYPSSNLSQAGPVFQSAPPQMSQSADKTNESSDEQVEAKPDLSVQEAAKAEWLAGMPPPRSVAEREARDQEWPRRWAMRTGAPMPKPPRLEEFAELLRVTGRNPDEALSICWDAGRGFQSDLGPVEQAPAYAWRFRAGHCWYGIAPLHLRVTKGRGREIDVIGLRSLGADLDVKAGGLPNADVCREVISGVSDLIGSQPVAVVSSGHGLQPYWAVEQGEETSWPDETDPRFTAAVALSRRFGRLVATVAHEHGGRVDTVSDLSRVLRVPGSINVKDPANPIEVTVEFPGGSPVSPARVMDACDALNLVEVKEDWEPLGVQVCEAGEWVFAEATCGYMRKAIEGWSTDSVDGSRHNGLLGKMTRLAAAHRNGCLTEEDYHAAHESLVGWFAELIAGTGRPVQPLEVQNAAEFGIRKVESFSDQRNAEELGNPPHVHRGQGGGDGPPEYGKPFTFTPAGRSERWRWRRRRR
jgi:hypothetical protein